MKRRLMAWVYRHVTALRSKVLQQTYRIEYCFFESLRGVDWDDAAYLGTKLRSAAHQIDKTLAFDKVTDMTCGRRRVEDLLQRYSALSEAQPELIAWVRDVLDTHERRQFGVEGRAAEPSPPHPEDAERTDRLVRTRRSIRSFRGDPLPDDALESILESGLWAPSGCDRQNVEYLVLSDAEDLRFCQRLAGEGYRFPAEAPVGVVVMVDPRGMALPGQRHMAWLEAGAAVQNMLLTAHARGIGSCWLNWAGGEAKGQQRFLERFELPGWLLPVSMVVFGYAAHSPALVPARKSLEQVVHHGTRVASERKAA